VQEARRAGQATSAPDIGVELQERALAAADIQDTIRPGRSIASRLEGRPLEPPGREVGIAPFGRGSGAQVARLLLEA